MDHRLHEKYMIRALLQVQVLMILIQVHYTCTSVDIAHVTQQEFFNSNKSNYY